MEQVEIEVLRYPVGRFTRPDSYTPALLTEWKETIRAFPELMERSVAGLSEGTMSKSYRPGGWSIAQVVHHCADSHMNAFIRFKLALTEENPTIKPYHEDLWAELPDANSSAELQESLLLLSGVHYRWARLMDSLTEAQWQRTFFHPERKVTLCLWETLAMYAWHSRHHLEHVRIAKSS